MAGRKHDSFNQHRNIKEAPRMQRKKNLGNINDQTNKLVIGQQEKVSRWDE